MKQLFPAILGAACVASQPNYPHDEIERDLKQQTKCLSDIVPAPSLRRLPLYARMGLLAAIRALEDSPSILPEELGLIIGTAHSCQKTSFDFLDSILNDGPSLASPLAFSHSVNNMAAGLLSILLKIQGPCHTVNCGELSFASAVQTAHALLLSEKAKFILVGMVDESDSRFNAIFPEFRENPMAAFFLLGLQKKGMGFDVDFCSEPENELDIQSDLEEKSETDICADLENKSIAKDKTKSVSSRTASLLCFDAWQSKHSLSVYTGEAWAKAYAKITIYSK